MYAHTYSRHYIRQAHQALSGLKETWLLMRPDQQSCQLHSLLLLIVTPRMQSWDKTWIHFWKMYRSVFCHKNVFILGKMYSILVEMYSVLVEMYSVLVEMYSVLVEMYSV